MVEVPRPHCYFCSLFPNASLFCIVYVGRCVLCVPLMCRYLQRPEEGLRSPGAGVTDGYELTGVGARNRTRILWRAIWTCSHFSSPNVASSHQNSKRACAAVCNASSVSPRLLLSLLYPFVVYFAEAS